MLLLRKTELQGDRRTHTWGSYLSIDEDMSEGGNNKLVKMDSQVSLSCNSGLRLVETDPHVRGSAGHRSCHLVARSDDRGPAAEGSVDTHDAISEIA